MTSRPHQLPPARRRAGLSRCPECGAHRSNLRRHVGHRHPDWELHRYAGGWYIARLVRAYFEGHGSSQ